MKRVRRSMQRVINFRLRRQEENEPISKYIAVLKLLAKSCEFNTINMEAAEHPVLFAIRKVTLVQYLETRSKVKRNHLIIKINV